MPLDATLKKARSAATALCLFAVVYAIVLMMGQGGGMPPLVIFGVVLITLTPFLAQWAVSLISERVRRGRNLPVPLLLMLAAMMVVPTLFWGLAFISRLGEALGASATSGLMTSAVSLGLAVLISGIPAALSAWLVIVFLRLSASQRRAA